MGYYIECPVTTEISAFSMSKDKFVAKTQDNTSVEVKDVIYYPQKGKMRLYLDGMQSHISEKVLVTAQGLFKISGEEYGFSTESYVSVAMNNKMEDVFVADIVYDEINDICSVNIINSGSERAEKTLVVFTKDNDSIRLLQKYNLSVEKDSFLTKTLEDTVDFKALGGKIYAILH